MDHECGISAFDNIDDVLADRIVNHSRSHSDRTEPPPEKRGASASPEKIIPECTGNDGIPVRILIVCALVIGIAVFLYRFTRRLSRR